MGLGNKNASTKGRGICPANCYVWTLS